MCFSAEASFGAAAALAGIGGLSVCRAPSRAHVPFAAIPLVFAAQQVCEGLVWLAVRDAPFHRSETSIARVFLFFALMLWPAYIPGALAPIEASRERRWALVGFSGGGLALGAYLMSCATLRRSDACIAFDNLYYWVQFDAPLKPFMALTYATFIIVPLFVSSVRGTTLLAVVAFLSFSATGLLYRAGFISVWCFVAAVLSGITASISALGRGTRGRLLAVPTSNQ